MRSPPLNGISCPEPGPCPQIRNRAPALPQSAKATALVPGMVKPAKFNDYNGWNNSDCIALIPAIHPVETWQLPRKVKAEVLGTRLLEGKDYIDDTLEPVFSNSFLGANFYTNMFDAYGAVGVLDLTAGAGEAAKAAIVKRLPYVGVCLTEQHAVKLEEELTEWVVKCQQQEGHPLFKQSATPAATQPAPAPAPQRKAAAGATGKDEGGDETEEPPKKTRKTPKRKKHESSESDSE